ncbi:MULTISPECIES: diguanylate cyclase [unclassified Anaerobiospirillum]|uniref:diguanylate cyclase domain-containing protein n=1 Tax=unclassified Anaerobiospirillum TaxID=2647410 RepID=UPI001FF2995D|nr:MULTISPECIES: diguanylate cyclase [unclassified Anaerobiospirillum]MCK0534394.1 diguanylate cyclase [Anaerobiospirillum sp. NML120511]MCK0539713.1 diguanylate cyclase [Anaerobiospirillum sp. NML02-A-032]
MTDNVDTSDHSAEQNSAASSGQQDNTAAAVEQTKSESRSLSRKNVSYAVAHNTFPYARLQGHWVYDGNSDSFLMDEICAACMGKTEYHKWYPVPEVICHVSAFDTARFAMNMRQNVLGDVIFERITMISGPYEGETFIIQGSVLERDETGQAIWATGYMSHESSPHSEFIPREMSGDGMYMWEGLEGNIVCSASMHAMLGLTEEEFPKTLADLVETLVHPDDNDFFLVLRQIKLSPQYGDYFESCMRLRHKNGEYIWAICRGLVQERNEDGIAIRGIGSVTNINLVQSSFDNIKLMMFTDSLTGLHNRNFFQQNAMRYEEEEYQPVSIIFIDVSGLKLTNDILGHSHGDYLLIKTRDIIHDAVKRVNSADYIRFKKAHEAVASVNDQLSSKDRSVPVPPDYGDRDFYEPLCSSPLCSYHRSLLEKVRQEAEQRVREELSRSGTSTSALAPSVTSRAALTPEEGTTVVSADKAITAADNAAAVTAGVTVDSEGSFIVNDTATAIKEGAMQIAAGKTGTTEEERSGNINTATANSAEEETDIEILRLAGDEFLVIIPNCPSGRAEDIALEILRIREQTNFYNETAVPLEERPVPICFGIGCATWGENGEEDSLKQVIDRADERMQVCKDERRVHDYEVLRRHFEAKKGRPVSMRDDRRVKIMKSHDEARRARVSNIIF